jgi:hypothetical protein
MSTEKFKIRGVPIKDGERLIFQEEGARGRKRLTVINDDCLIYFFPSNYDHYSTRRVKSIVEAEIIYDNMIVESPK